MRIIEIFGSVQGEGPDAGTPTVFVRTARCNLRCVWCDSEYTFAGGEEMPLSSVIERTLAFGLPAACITGGEPTLQPEAPELAQTLLALGKRVSLFTNGTRPLDKYPQRVRKVVDLKPPSALIGDRVSWDNLACLDSKDVVKFVLREERDFHWALQTARRGGLLVAEGDRWVRPESKPQTWVAPSFGDIEARDLVSWILRERADVQLNMQVHKFIWSPEQRGV
jgi:7-carboxy-7-deazaguanine synthase